jgi:hypothetical protein
MVKIQQIGFLVSSSTGNDFLNGNGFVKVFWLPSLYWIIGVNCNGMDHPFAPQGEINCV